MIFLFIFVFLINVQFFFYRNDVANTTQSIEEVNIIYCSPENGDQFKEFLKYWTVIDLSVNVLIPFAVMILCSIIIIFGIIDSTKNITVVKSDKKRINLIKTEQSMPMLKIKNAEASKPKRSSGIESTFIKMI